MIAFIYQPVIRGEKSRLWSARVRLDNWPRPRHFALHVTDKRVAIQKLQELISELEREDAGVGIPKLTRSSLKQSLMEHHADFIAACIAAKLSPNTLNKYRHSIPLLIKRCGWQTVRDISPSSFTQWRSRCGLAPKSVNDLLGSLRTMLLWMKREHRILNDPLADVRKVPNPGAGGFRRALSLEEMRRLLATAPRHRAIVYQVILYTGLRRAEMAGLRWDDFKLDDAQPCVRVPSSISKNRKETVHYLRPEVVASLKELRPNGVRPDKIVFQGLMPRVPTLKRDLAAAGIPFEDARGRRVDLHALRKSFGTMLAVAGIAPRVAMEMMRHSDMKLTMGVYTDVAQLPLIESAQKLPSLELPSNGGKRTHRTRVVTPNGAQLHA